MLYEHIRDEVGGDADVQIGWARSGSYSFSELKYENKYCALVGDELRVFATLFQRTDRDTRWVLVSAQELTPDEIGNEHRCKLRSAAATFRSEKSHTILADDLAMKPLGFVAVLLLTIQFLLSYKYIGAFRQLGISLPRFAAPSCIAGTDISLVTAMSKGVVFKQLGSELIIRKAGLQGIFSVIAVVESSAQNHVVRYLWLPGFALFPLSFLLLIVEVGLHLGIGNPNGYLFAALGSFFTAGICLFGLRHSVKQLDACIRTKSMPNP